MLGEDSKKYTEAKIEDLISYEEALYSIGSKPENIDLIIQTHLHFNQCGNTAKCKNARVVVQKSELDFAFGTNP